MLLLVTLLVVGVAYVGQGEIVKKVENPFMSSYYIP